MVTRYKPSDAPLLGASGLLRAYGSAARCVLRAAERTEVIPTSTVKITSSLSTLGALQPLIARWEARRPGDGRLGRIAEDYDADNVVLTVVMEDDFLQDFEDSCTEAAGGQAKVAVVAPHTAD